MSLHSHSFIVAILDNCLSVSDLLACRIDGYSPIPRLSSRSSVHAHGWLCIALYLKFLHLNRYVSQDSPHSLSSATHHPHPHPHPPTVSVPAQSPNPNLHPKAPPLPPPHSAPPTATQAETPNSHSNNTDAASSCAKSLVADTVSWRRHSRSPSPARSRLRRGTPWRRWPCARGALRDRGCGRRRARRAWRRSRAGLLGEGRRPRARCAVQVWRLCSRRVWRFGSRSTCCCCQFSGGNGGREGECVYHEA